MKKDKKEIDEALMEAAVMSGNYTPEPKPEPFDFDTFKFEKLEDFEVYNSHVRKHNRACVQERNKMKVKVPNESFYKKYKTKFHRFEQMQNVLKVRVRNKHIDWRGELKSGGT